MSGATSDRLGEIEQLVRSAADKLAGEIHREKRDAVLRVLDLARERGLMDEEQALELLECSGFPMTGAMHLRSMTRRAKKRL